MRVEILLIFPFSDQYELKKGLDLNMKKILVI